MKTFFSVLRYVCRGLPLLVLGTALMLPPGAQADSALSRSLRKIKNRVDRALDRVGIRKDEDPPVSGGGEYRGPQEPSDPERGRAPLPDERRSRAPTTSPPAGTRPLKPTVRPPSSESTPAPATREKRPRSEVAKPAAPRKGDTPETAAGPSAKGKPDGPAEGAAVPPVPPPTPEPVQYAKPVLGKRGFVYAPGMAEEMKNILDVRDAKPGQKMRDPRTGTLFLVP